MNEKLFRVGIRSPLDLALLAPHKYYDFRIKRSIEPQMVLDVQIKEIQTLAKLQKRIAYAHNIGREVELLFFHTKKFHEYAFGVGERLFIYGKLQFQYGKIQIVQPQKVANYKIDQIFPSYKIPIRGDIFASLKKEYLTAKALAHEGLPQDIVESLLKIHYPDEEFYKEYQKEGGIFGRYFEALKFAEAYRYIRALRHKRINRPAQCVIDAKYQDFVASLPFTLTNDQQKVIDEIRRDLGKDVAARRVVVGDVGSGKSVVMFATAYMAKRSILMAPTSVLARQLYEEAKRLMPKNFKIALVSAQENVENLEEYDFIIGTHALLYRKLPKVCVVMVDEQHRFGTNQRQKLKKLVESGDQSPHYFQFSATPIPRTQAMMESALVDYSFIQEVPFKKDITTKVVGKEDFRLLLAHIKREISQDHQVLIVYPLVEESATYGYKSLEEAKNFWMRYFDGVYVTHGKDKAKEEALAAFAKNGNILLATTVIEVGISLPKLSTIVIVGAENLGLATLHQLRGRVSRTGLKGYCFLYTNNKENERLQKFSKITSGFAIAELDLAFRKSGDIVSGKEQSGKTFKYLSLAEDKKIIERVKALLDQ
ncbi:ATP-dependent DNA helicase RecG [Nitratiruptor sp. YY09-18]|uniref:ATP-dependent DNA helicase RecG n=1 Tax=Nitratiruptor sp. YY09-18 TaxID=2724901 RepID=UPI0019164A4C|nr:ATP-dependent DNA helicase RecG [Nitratiruptor sp. YY09-18]BCD67657.1 ATP-dependent DNA helicase RecG [Nitratiruptor sp. YY09-18]